MAALPLADIQGLILRSYGMAALRLFLLRVVNAGACREKIGQLPITSAQPWQTKPECCLNVALTYQGLRALEVSEATLATFPEEFRQGAVARSPLIGDTGDSAPEKWKAEYVEPGPHILVLLFAKDAVVREEQTDALRALWNGAVREVTVQDGDMLPGSVAHFGYQDGFSQPAVQGGFDNPIPDILAPAPAGEFLLGYPSQFTDFTYPVPDPPAIGLNGSFLALRILEQDCAAFERLLSEAPAKFGIDREKLAAKLVGRWRNGVPLMQSPESDTPSEPIPLEQLNAYDYVDDPKGYRCPAGSHMRRNNPRSAPIAGDGGLKHRIMRRGLPYGPLYDPDHPNNGIERGLLGLFIGVSLKDQFEFLMTEWVNGSLFAAGLSGTKDPILGDNSGGTGRFIIPLKGAEPIVVTGFSRLVQTRGAAYGFLPSLSALQYIAKL